MKGPNARPEDSDHQGCAGEVAGAASLILGRVRQAETSTRLKLLEIELGLAELREELGKR